MTSDAQQRPIRVVVVDDHPTVRKGLAAILSEFPDMEMVGAAGTGLDGVECVELNRPRVVLLDLELPDIHGLEVMQMMLRRFDRIRILVLTIHDEPEIARQALLGGAAGYVLKDADQEELVSAIRVVADGGEHFAPGLVKNVLSTESPDHLTRRELSVLRLLAEGLSNREIGEALIVSPETIKSHVSAIYRKLEVSDRAQAVSKGLRTGLIS